MLLDDYLMAPERISGSWQRRHAPKLKYWPDMTGRAWCDIVNRFWVVTTDTQQIERHRQWIARQGLLAEVRYLAPLWRS